MSEEKKYCSSCGGMRPCSAFSKWKTCDKHHTKEALDKRSTYLKKHRQVIKQKQVCPPENNPQETPKPDPEVQDVQVLEVTPVEEKPKKSKAKRDKPLKEKAKTESKKPKVGRPQNKIHHATFYKDYRTKHNLKGNEITDAMRKAWQEYNKPS